jgi:hypothetical protein
MVMASGNGKQMSHSEDERPLNADAAADIRQLHRLLQEAQARVIDPSVENLNTCHSRLNEAVDRLRRLQTGIAREKTKCDAAVSGPLRTLRSEIIRVAILLDSAAAFHSGWLCLARSLAAGYSADGTPAQLEPTPRMALEI